MKKRWGGEVQGNIEVGKEVGWRGGILKKIEDAKNRSERERV